MKSFQLNLLLIRLRVPPLVQRPTCQLLECTLSFSFERFCVILTTDSG
jgi:hypothetical protein